MTAERKRQPLPQKDESWIPSPEEPSALPPSENKYGLSGKALRDYLSTIKIACETLL
jgi:hypothetical protein